MFTNPGLTFFTWVTFLVLLGLLSRYGWGPILESISEREDRIHDDLASARRQRQEAEELLQQRQEALNEARSEARQIVEEGRQKGERAREEIVEEAERKADSMVETARSKIEEERRQAFRSVRGDVGDLAVRLAEKILREEIDEEDHRRLIDEFVENADEGQVQVG